MDRIAEAYVKLVLEIGLYDLDYVDAYYGPQEWHLSETIKVDPFPFDRLSQQISDLIEQIESIKVEQLENIEKQRKASLYKQLKSVQAKIEMTSGKKFTFDEESKLLYDAVAPIHDESYFDKLLERIGEALPGKGSVTERFDEFKKDFIIPKEKLDSVFKTAIAECSKRTLKYIDLPSNESFSVEYVTNKFWGGYNRYKGNSYSLIQLNTDLPSYIDRAVNLAAHEGYPGHHVYNTLLEKHLFNTREWLEYSVYPLFSPQSLISEGSANYGIKIVLPREDRIKYEREVLFPIAGLDKNRAEHYYEIMMITNGLGYARNEVARNYLDGKINRIEALDWLILYTLSTPERAKKQLSFIENVRSYVINYNLGEDIVKDYIESSADTINNPEKSWEVFTELLSTPQTPSALIAVTRERGKRYS